MSSFPHQPSTSDAWSLLNQWFGPVSPIAHSHCDVAGQRLWFDVHPWHQAPLVDGVIYMASEAQTQTGWPIQYIGKTDRSLRERLKEHDQEAKLWWLKSPYVHVLKVNDAWTRSIIETALIDTLSPPGNRVRGPLSYLFE